jgi:multimeric flavodoxin WrbA
MKVLAINGSPRKKRNTATLLGKAIEGATSQGADTELIHLYDLDFKGCRACYSCKLIGGKSYGKCAARDDLTPILKEVEEVDAIIVGSPIYFWSVTGESRSFLERLMYPFWNLADSSVLPQKRIPTGLIYTMGAPEDQMKERGWDQQLLLIEMVMKMIFGMSESLFVNDTSPFDDYTKHAISPTVDPQEKARIREEVFPEDCEKAFEMGVRFARPSGNGD